MRFDGIRNVIARVAHVFDTLDVQFVADNREHILAQVSDVIAAKQNFVKRLTVLDRGGVTRGSAQHRRFFRDSHARFERGVDIVLVRYRERSKVNGFGRGRIHRANDIAVDFLGNERHERRDEPCRSFEYGVQRHVRGFFVLGHVAAPVTLAATAHVPVGEFIHEVADLARGFGDLVVFERVVHELDKRVHSRQYPLVHNGQFALVQSIFRRVELVDLGVENIERIGVEQRAEEFSLHFADCLAVEARGNPRA